MSKYIFVIVFLIALLVLGDVDAWDYIQVFTDIVGDNGGPGYTNIMSVIYVFNETHVSVNITVNNAIPAPYDNGILFYEFFPLDSVKNPSTGYNYLEELVLTTLLKHTLITLHKNPLLNSGTY